MRTLYDVFLDAVGGDQKKLFSSPGPSGVAALFSECGIITSQGVVTAVYQQNDWSAERSFTCQ